MTRTPEEQWADCQRLASETGLPCRHIAYEDLNSELMALLPMEVLRNYRILPLDRHEDKITLAMADPLDVMAEDAVRFKTGCHVERVIAPPGEIEDALQGRLGPVDTLISNILHRIPESSELELLHEPEEEEEKQEDITPSAPIIQLVNSLISDAIRMRASDIHVEPLEEKLRVRYRIDGYLRTVVSLPKRIQGSTISRLKLISGIDISESRKPQDGRTRVRLEGREVDLRVSALPTHYGEKIVLRILDPEKVVVDLDALGLTPEDFSRLQSVLGAGQGMVLATGPTGSGKTSTLYGALRYLNVEADNLVTVEDPIEYRLEGVNQVQMNPRAGLTFATALRSILRQDPDTVMVGEIRDLETAEIAVQAAQTGHLVLSTLHTNDAVSTVTRLILMGIPPYMVASSLLAVVAQRLVRRLCQACRWERPVTPAAARLLSLAGQPVPRSDYVANGCPACDFVGYKGRIGLFELILVSDRIREILLSDPREILISQAAREEGTRSLLEDGLSKVSQGLTSLSEVLRAITVRSPGGRSCPQCHRPVPTQLGVCVFCGADLQLHCPMCHQDVEADWLVCPHCRSPRPGPPDNRRRIMLLSQDEPLVEQVGGVVQSQDWQLLVSSDPREALALIWSQKPDVILADLALTSLDLPELGRTLGSSLGMASTRLVFLSDRAERHDPLADTYLSKPVDSAQLLARIKP
ncbi:type II secretion system protein GspE [bacterium CPR1]|nr:type II secretion system protein GspE [bacterium CPR1]